MNETQLAHQTAKELYDYVDRISDSLGEYDDALVSKIVMGNWNNRPLFWQLFHSFTKYRNLVAFYLKCRASGLTLLNNETEIKLI